METIDDIVREMREGFNQSWWDVDREWAHGLADRIEKAFIECVVNMDLSCIVNKQDISYLKGRLEESSDTFQRLMEENARLKAALKPVLEFEPLVDMEDERHGTIVVVNAVSAVSSAKRIYKEGAK